MLVLSESWPTVVRSQEQEHSEPRSRHTDMFLRRKRASHKAVGRLEGNKFPRKNTRTQEMIQEARPRGPK